MDSKSYGPLKAACERVAVSRLGESVTSIVRPAYVCGPHDNEESFTYWARRMAEGGAVVIRGASRRCRSSTCATWAFLLSCAVNRVAGVFDGVGPAAPTSELLAEITPRGVEAQLIEIDATTLAASGITLPMMSDDPNDAVISSRPGTQARRAGSLTRSAADTADATRAWDDARGRPPLQVGPSRDRKLPWRQCGNRDRTHDPWVVGSILPGPLLPGPLKRPASTATYGGASEECGETPGRERAVVLRDGDGVGDEVLEDVRVAVYMSLAMTGRLPDDAELMVAGGDDNVAWVIAPRRAAGVEAWDLTARSCWRIRSRAIVRVQRDERADVVVERLRLGCVRDPASGAGVWPGGGRQPVPVLRSGAGLARRRLGASDRSLSERTSSFRLRTCGTT